MTPCLLACTPVPFLKCVYSKRTAFGEDYSWLTSNGVFRKKKTVVPSP